MIRQYKKVVLHQMQSIVFGIIEREHKHVEIQSSFFYLTKCHHFLAQRHEISGDPSVCTYRGHSVGYTLIRCYFSPSFTTGQRYIITGSSDGCIYSESFLCSMITRKRFLF